MKQFTFFLVVLFVFGVGFLIGLHSSACPALQSCCPVAGKDCCEKQDSPSCCKPRHAGADAPPDVSSVPSPAEIEQHRKATENTHKPTNSK